MNENFFAIMKSSLQPMMDAAEINIDEIVMRAQVYVDDGADVIDIGCLPDTDFPHLEEAVRTLIAWAGDNPERLRTIAGQIPSPPQGPASASAARMNARTVSKMSTISETFSFTCG